MSKRKITDGLQEIKGMADCYEYLPSADEIIMKENGEEIALLRVQELSDYHVNFFVYEATGWTGIRYNKLSMIAPVADVYLKWDGCSTWNVEDNHMCGFKVLLRRHKIEQWAFKTAHALIKHGDKECAGLEDK